MKVHLVIEVYSTGHSIVYGAFSSKAKAINCIDYIVDCCIKEDWVATWENAPYSYEHEVRLKAPSETQNYRVGYHLVTRDVK